MCLNTTCRWSRVLNHFGSNCQRAGVIIEHFILFTFSKPFQYTMQKLVQKANVCTSPGYVSWYFNVNLWLSNQNLWKDDLEEGQLTQKTDSWTLRLNNVFSLHWNHFNNQSYVSKGGAPRSSLGRTILACFCDKSVNWPLWN